jgi:hypothetical protein
MVTWCVGYAASNPRSCEVKWDLASAGHENITLHMPEATCCGVETSGQKPEAACCGDNRSRRSPDLLG